MPGMRRILYTQIRACAVARVNPCNKQSCWVKGHFSLTLMASEASVLASDCLLIRFEVEDHSQFIPKSLKDLSKVQIAMQEETQGLQSMHNLITSSGNSDHF